MVKKSFMLLVLLLVGVMVLSGCAEEGADPVEEPGEHEHENSYDEDITFEVIDRGEDDVTAYVHVDHWHGELPEVPEGDNISLGAYIEDDGEEMELDGDHYALGVDYASGADEDVVSFDHHGDHVHIVGEKEGKTELVFQLLHDDHVDYETPPIEVMVAHN